MRKPPKSVSRRAMRELDRAAIEDCGVPGRLLMENAGRAVTEEVLHFLRAEKVGRALRATHASDQVAAEDHMPAEPKTVDELEIWKAELRRVDGPVGILCGPGNNGGDGFVVARTLYNHDVDVRVCFVGNPQTAVRAGDAGDNFALLERVGQTVVFIAGETDILRMKQDFGSCRILVDALFGTGLTRPLDGLHHAAVTAFNELAKPCVAVDIPSGLDCDTGEILGAAVRADVTVTFGAAKHGLVRGQGPALCGRINVAEIGIPRALILAALADESSA